MLVVSVFNGGIKRPPRWMGSPSGAIVTVLRRPRGLREARQPGEFPQRERIASNGGLGKGAGASNAPYTGHRALCLRIADPTERLCKPGKIASKMLSNKALALGSGSLVSSGAASRPGGDKAVFGKTAVCS
jgi:hypothetical protein